MAKNQNKVLELARNVHAAVENNGGLIGDQIVEPYTQPELEPTGVASFSVVLDGEEYWVTVAKG